jgi:hypothetical protein
MRRKNDTVSTAGPKIEDGARLAVEEESFGWHVPKHDDEFAV